MQQQSETLTSLLKHPITPALTNVCTGANKVVDQPRKKKRRKENPFCCRSLRVTECRGLSGWKLISETVSSHSSMAGSNTWWMASIWGRGSISATALNKHDCPAGPNIRLMDSFWLNYLFCWCVICSGWAPASRLPLTLSGSIHGSTLPAFISISDAKEEIQREIILGYFPVPLSLLPLMNHCSWELHYIFFLLGVQARKRSSAALDIQQCKTTTAPSSDGAKAWPK